jgi:hypothetical protein
VDEPGRTGARQSSEANTLGGTVNTVSGTSAMTPEAAMVDPAAAESRRCAEEAQQLSACAWLTTRVKECWWLSDVCIGQVVLFMQHAIRASGVGCQPAQTATFPTTSVRRATIAAPRRISGTTFPSMLDELTGVKSHECLGCVTICNLLGSRRRCRPRG